jgi:hypothetical protein
VIPNSPIMTDSQTGMATSESQLQIPFNLSTQRGSVILGEQRLLRLCLGRPRRLHQRTAFVISRGFVLDQWSFPSSIWQAATPGLAGLN